MCVCAYNKNDDHLFFSPENWCYCCHFPSNFPTAQSVLFRPKTYNPVKWEFLNRLHSVREGFFKVNFNPKLPSSPLCFLFFNPSLLLSELAWCSESQGSWVLIQRGRQRKWLFGTLYYSHHSKVLIDAEVHYSQKISGYHGIHVGINALIFWMLPVLKLTRYLSASRYRECQRALKITMNSGFFSGPAILGKMQ